MSMHTRSIAGTLLAALTLAGLAGCGGGGGGESTAVTPPATSNEVPASALASAAAFTLFVGSLGTSETQAPLDVATLVPPTSDTTEPLSVK